MPFLLFFFSSEGAIQQNVRLTIKVIVQSQKIEGNKMNCFISYKLKQLQLDGLLFRSQILGDFVVLHFLFHFDLGTFYIFIIFILVSIYLKCLFWYQYFKK